MDEGLYPIFVTVPDGCVDGANRAGLRRRVYGEGGYGECVPAGSLIAHSPYRKGNINGVNRRDERAVSASVRDRSASER